jgi:hypothetical protein
LGQERRSADFRVRSVHAPTSGHSSGQLVSLFGATFRRSRLRHTLRKDSSPGMQRRGLSKCSAAGQIWLQRLVIDSAPGRTQGHSARRARARGQPVRARRGDDGAPVAHGPRLSMPRHVVLKLKGQPLPELIPCMNTRKEKPPKLRVDQSDTASASRRRTVQKCWAAAALSGRTWARGD